MKINNRGSLTTTSIETHLYTAGFLALIIFVLWLLKPKKKEEKRMAAHPDEHTYDELHAKLTTSKDKLTMEERTRLSYILVPPEGQGHMYAYRIPHVGVSVNFQGGVSKSDWSLVKVGRSDPTKVEKRLHGEAALFMGARQKLTVPPVLGIPRADTGKGKKKLLQTEAAFVAGVYEKWTTYNDMLFLFPADVGKEAEYRHYPTGVGVEIGTGRLIKQPTDMHLEWFFTNIRLKACALQAWVMGMSMNTNGATPTSMGKDSLGASEWVVIPHDLITDLRSNIIRSEVDFLTLVEKAYAHYDALPAIESVKITLGARPNHTSLDIHKSEKVEWPAGKPVKTE